MALKAARKLTSDEVIHTLTELFCCKGKPEYIRSDHGAEFSAKAVRSWLGELEVAPLYIERGSPCGNGYVESFNDKKRDERLNREQIDTLREACVLLEQWRHHYNIRRPHSSLGNKTPSGFALDQRILKTQPVRLDPNIICVQKTGEGRPGGTSLR